MKIKMNSYVKCFLFPTQQRRAELHWIRYEPSGQTDEQTVAVGAATEALSYSRTSEGAVKQTLQHCRVQVPVRRVVIEKKSNYSAQWLSVLLFGLGLDAVCGTIPATAPPLSPTSVNHVDWGRWRCSDVPCSDDGSKWCLNSWACTRFQVKRNSISIYTSWGNKNVELKEFHFVLSTPTWPMWAQGGGLETCSRSFFINYLRGTNTVSFLLFAIRTCYIKIVDVFWPQMLTHNKLFIVVVVVVVSLL